MPKKDAPTKMTAKSINTNPWVKIAAPPSEKRETASATTNSFNKSAKAVAASFTWLTRNRPFAGRSPSPLSDPVGQIRHLGSLNELWCKSGVGIMNRWHDWLPVEELFKGRHFDGEIVVLCVRWY